MSYMPKCPNAHLGCPKLSSWVTLCQLKGLLWTRTNEGMKNQVDKGRVDKEFQEGDLVLAKLQPYKQHSLKLSCNQKFSMRYFGPFPMLQHIGKVAYKLKLLDSAQIRPAFHITMLKQFKGDTSIPYYSLPLVTTEAGPMLQPCFILAMRKLHSADSELTQIVVEWEGLSPRNATWEDSDGFRSCYPHYHLEGKVEIEEGGIVMVPAREEEPEQVINNSQEQLVEEVGDVEEVITLKHGKGCREKFPNRMLRDFVVQY